LQGLNHKITRGCVPQLAKNRRMGEIRIWISFFPEKQWAVKGKTSRPIGQMDEAAGAPLL